MWQFYYKLGQLLLLQLGARVITNCSSTYYYKPGQYHYKSGQLLKSIKLKLLSYWLDNVHLYQDQSKLKRKKLPILANLYLIFGFVCRKTTSFWENNAWQSADQTQDCCSSKNLHVFIKTCSIFHKLVNCKPYLEKKSFHWL